LPATNSGYGTKSGDPYCTELGSEGEMKWQRGVFWLAVAVALVGGIWWIAPFLSPVQTNSAVGEEMPNLGYGTVPYGQPIQYRFLPPTSGVGYPAPAPSGVYPQGLSPGYWVRSLDQGYIVVLYRPPVPNMMLWEFQLMVWTFPRNKFGNVKLIIAPYAEMPHPFAILAWNWRLWLDNLDRPKVLAFYRIHVDHGVENVP